MSLHGIIWSGQNQGRGLWAACAQAAEFQVIVGPSQRCYLDLPFPATYREKTWGPENTGPKWHQVSTVRSTSKTSGSQYKTPRSPPSVLISALFFSVFLIIKYPIALLKQNFNQKPNILNRFNRTWLDTDREGRKSVMCYRASTPRSWQPSRGFGTEQSQQVLWSGDTH